MCVMCVMLCWFVLLLCVFACEVMRLNVNYVAHEDRSKTKYRQMKEERDDLKQENDVLMEQRDDVETQRDELPQEMEEGSPTDTCLCQVCQY